MPNTLTELFFVLTASALTIASLLAATLYMGAYIHDLAESRLK